MIFYSPCATLADVTDERVLILRVWSLIRLSLLLTDVYSEVSIVRLYGVQKTKRPISRREIGRYKCEQIRFTNNVSWLGDPRLKKGRYR